jgi:hypothetical protein
VTSEVASVLKAVLRLVFFSHCNVC